MTTPWQKYTQSAIDVHRGDTANTKWRDQKLPPKVTISKLSTKKEIRFRERQAYVEVGIGNLYHCWQISSYYPWLCQAYKCLTGACHKNYFVRGRISNLLLNNAENEILWCE